jgi:hypothetical protein
MVVLLHAEHNVASARVGKRAHGLEQTYSLIGVESSFVLERDALWFVILE